MAFQDDLALKKPQKPSATIDSINNSNPRRFLVVWAIPVVLVFILKELPIGVMQIIPFFAWANQNYQTEYISKQYDPSIVSLTANCSFFCGIQNKCPSWTSFC